ncbi:hypothetical protein FQR65_LT13210 [Abscondita terminalis]|nr:hypothetical protein FQR65_LT13210 [Abscondita terminalis]
MLGSVSTHKEQLQIEEEDEKHNDIIQGSFIDNYRNLSYKHAMTLKYVTYHCSQIQYVLKVDDDIFVNIPAILDFLRKDITTYGPQGRMLCLPSKNLVVERGDTKWKTSEEEYNKTHFPQFCFGFCAIYSPDVVLQLYRQVQKTNFFWLEDVFVTVVLYILWSIKKEKTIIKEIIIHHEIAKKEIIIKEVAKKEIINPDSITCYRLDDRTLPDISDEKIVKDGKSIFFLETSCNSYINDKIFLQARQACAVESAALNNPDHSVYLLFVSPGIIKHEDTESGRILNALLRYKNVHFYHLNYEKYTKDTPVENLYKELKVENSKYPQSHASDVLRFLTMWKYGGVYLDLDVVVLKPLSDLPSNFAALETKEDIGSAVLGFSSNGSGHEFAQICLEELKNHFRGDEWSYNGPGLLSRLLSKLCGVPPSKKMLTKDCDGFKVFPHSSFYPVPFNWWKLYFESESLNYINYLTTNSYTVHIWNKLSGNTKIRVGDSVPYTLFAKKHCPKVFAECKELF